jgi:hypothetical protein
MRIELLGPSGVGKSTILRVAQEMRAHEPEWIGPLEADDILHKTPSSTNKALTRAAIDNTDRAAFVDHCLSTVMFSSMLRSQKFSALAILQNSFYESLLLDDVPDDTILVHDELLLHRAFSLLLYSDNVERDAMTYFQLVPLPDAAVVFCTDDESILSRVRGRRSLPNVYTDLDESGLRRIITAGIKVARVAELVLRDRGLNVKTIETQASEARTARILYEFCIEPRTRE